MLPLHKDVQSSIKFRSRGVYRVRHAENSVVNESHSTMASYYNRPATKK